MYTADIKRYENMQYRRCGASGIQLSLVSLGLWHNFGDEDDFKNACNMAYTDFDLSITILTWLITMVPRLEQRK